MKQTKSDNPYSPFSDLPMFTQGESRDDQSKKIGKYEEGVRDTSLQAFTEGVESGNFNSQEEKILALLKSAGVDMTLKEISKATGIEINAVSGRVNTMKGPSRMTVTECPKRPCTLTGKFVTPVRAL